jgi:hypothetical protein
MDLQQYAFTNIAAPDPWRRQMCWYTSAISHGKPVIVFEAPVVVAFILWDLHEQKNRCCQRHSSIVAIEALTSVRLLYPLHYFK